MTPPVVRPNVRGLSAGLLALFLVACGATPERAAPQSVEGDRLRLRPVGLVIDSCVIHSEAGSSYVVTESSEQAGQTIERQFRSALHVNGLKVVRALRPWLCGNLEADQAATLQVAAKARSRPQAAELPVLRERYTTRPWYAPAVALLQTLASGRSSMQMPKVEARIPLQFTADELEQLRRALSAEMAWVVTAQVRQGAANAAQAAYIIALVDLETGELVWRKRTEARADRNRPGAIPEAWVADMLVPMFEGRVPVVAGDYAPRPAPAAPLETATAPRPVPAAPVPAAAARPQPPAAPTPAPSAPTPATAPAPTPAQARTAPPPPPAMVAPASAPPAATPTRPLTAPAPPVIAAPASAPEPTAPPAPKPRASLGPDTALLAASPLALRRRPNAEDELRTTIAAGTAFRTVSAQQQGGVKWWFVRTGTQAGWARETDVLRSTREN